MLDEHFFERLSRNIGINGIAYQSSEIFKSPHKGGVALALVFNEAKQSLPQLRHLELKLFHRLVPLLKGRGFIFKEQFENIDQLFRFGQVGIQHQLTILKQDGPLWRLKKNVIARIAFFYLLLDLFAQIIGRIFSLPQPMQQPKTIYNSAIYTQVLTVTLNGKLLDQ
ncbi:hypothetical protein SDC9_113059 [bioreactor metagenome]|uniref:Uncharacterized protein n=1 Tax=bioreactor metagenome TaxID=1076179 RepID=A0A645BLT6_9ZZZZ